MSNIQTLIDVLQFTTANRGGKNCYYNTNTSTDYKLAFKAVFNQIKEVGSDNGLTVGDNVYKANVSTKGQAYINMMPSAVVGLSAEGLEEFEQGALKAKEARKQWKEEHAAKEEESAQF